MMSGRYFHFLNADSVEYEYSSDDLTSSRYGKAKYRVMSNKLTLRFDGTSPPPSSVQAKTEATSRDNVNLTCRVTGVMRNGESNISGVNFVVQDVAGKIIEGAATAADGTASLQVASNRQPRRVVFSAIGWLSVEHPLNNSDAAFHVLLQPYRGEVYDAGKEITFGIASISSNRLVLKRGKDRIVFVKN